MRIFVLQPLEAVCTNTVACAKEWRLQGLRGCETLGWIVLEKTGEQLVALRTQRGERGVGVGPGRACMGDGAVVPLLEV